ncbi:hypothetical protein HBH98_135070 [Parastagonospora nodorum]|nr:hypothetical protein HBH43_011630 [Parastagonospora nodorum]KAH4190796.1 hypothetical protein HBI95_216140 [Parastagonospora nodorum]KAH4344647.1 hypothetical protein HBH98_135070 [Parastagonospora nodorum]KAH4373778.1 hypothetical protein HBH97_125430 [Parastagonospora nodorum]KAH4421076.1 hypothetical protein HBH99_052650 [Parastagonospora nodorum]
MTSPSKPAMYVQCEIENLAKLIKDNTRFLYGAQYIYIITTAQDLNTSTGDDTLDVMDVDFSAQILLADSDLDLLDYTLKANSKHRNRLAINNARFLYGSNYTYNIVTAQGPDEGPCHYQKAKAMLVRYRYDDKSVGEVLRIGEVHDNRSQTPKVEDAIVVLNVLLRREVNAGIKNVDLKEGHKFDKGMGEARTCYLRLG